MSDSNVALRLSSKRKPTIRKRYFVRPSLRSAPLGLELENEDRLKGTKVIFAKDLWAPGFPHWPEIPRFRHHRKEGRLPRDLEDYSGYWLVSQRMRALMERVDQNAFAFAPCKLLLADGSLGAELWLCDVVRILDVLDEKLSQVEIWWEGSRKTYRIRSGQKALVFKDDLISCASIFRLEYARPKIVCDDVFRQACKIEKMQTIDFFEAT